MTANLENSAVATGLEKISFHSIPKERQCQRIFKLPYNCTHFICEPAKAMATHSSTLAWEIPWTEEPGRLQSMGSLSQTWLSDFTFTFHFHVLEKEMATHSSVLAWRIPGTGEPGRLLSMGLHRVGHDWSDLAAAAAPRIGSVSLTYHQICSVPEMLLSVLSTMLFDTYNTLQDVLSLYKDY